MTILRVESLQAGYGQIRAVRDANLELEKGELVVLVGANGAGKTTLLRAISGLHRPSAGSVTLMGKDVSGLSAEGLVRRGMGHVPEGRHIFGRMTVHENLKVATWGMGKKFPERANHVFKMFPILEQRREQVAGTLSGGEQQMLALGRALMRQPDVLLLDEPSMGLAPIIVNHIFDMITEIHAQGTTILLVEQNASRALDIADRAYVMELGTVSGGGSARAFLDDVNLRAVYLGKDS